MPLRKYIYFFVLLDVRPVQPVAPSLVPLEQPAKKPGREKQMRVVKLALLLFSTMSFGHPRTPGVSSAVRNAIENPPGQGGGSNKPPSAVGLALGFGVPAGGLLTLLGWISHKEREQEKISALYACLELVSFLMYRVPSSFHSPSPFLAILEFNKYLCLGLFLTPSLRLSSRTWRNPT